MGSTEEQALTEARKVHSYCFKVVLMELIRETEDIRRNVLEHPSFGTNTHEGQGGFYYCIRDDTPGLIYLLLYVYKRRVPHPANYMSLELERSKWSCETRSIREASVDDVWTDTSWGGHLTEGAKDLVMSNRRERWSYDIVSREAYFRKKSFFRQEPIRSLMDLENYERENIMDALIKENRLLREEVIELRYRPGGPGYEIAREHFENVPRHVFDDAL